MERLIAYRANKPERLHAALLAKQTLLFPEVPQEALSTDSANSDPGQSGEQDTAAKLRWGIGYYIGGEPHVQRFVATLQQGIIALSALRADVVLAQAGPEDSAVSPYRYGRYLLGLHGPVPKLSGAELFAPLPPFLQANLRDHSPAERLLHRVLGRLHDAAPEYLQDPALAPEVAVAALAAVLRSVGGASLSTPASANSNPSPEASCSMTMTNGDWLIIAQHGASSIWYEDQALASKAPEKAETPGYRSLWALSRPDLDAANARQNECKPLPADSAWIVNSDLTSRILPLG